MVVTIIAWISIVASVAGILLANRICQKEMSREGVQIICSLVFCWVGTWQITDLSGLESGLQDVIRPWKIVGATMLAIAMLLCWLSKRIK